MKNGFRAKSFERETFSHTMAPGGGIWVTVTFLVLIEGGHWTPFFKGIRKFSLFQILFCIKGKIMISQT